MLGLTAALTVASKAPLIKIGKILFVASTINSIRVYKKSNKKKGR